MNWKNLIVFAQIREETGQLELFWFRNELKQLDKLEFGKGVWLYEMPVLRKGNGTGIYQKPATDFLE